MHLDDDDDDDDDAWLFPWRGQLLHLESSPSNVALI